MVGERLTEPQRSSLPKSGTGRGLARRASPLSHPGLATASCSFGINAPTGRGGPPEKAAPLLYADRSDRFDPSPTSDPALGPPHLTPFPPQLGKGTDGSLRLRP